MGKSDIQSWIASTSEIDDSENTNGESSQSQRGWRRENILSDWTRSLELARSQLLSSSTKVRTQFLREELLGLARQDELSLSQILDIYKLLTLTYSRYVDTPSREAVEEVGTELVRRDELRGRSDGDQDETPLGVTEQIIGWLSTEVSQIAHRASSHAAADVFILLSWACGLYVVCLKVNPEFPSSIAWNNLLSAVAVSVDMLLDRTARIKPSIQKGTLTRVRRALRSCPEHISTAIRTLLAKGKTSQQALHVVPLLGICVDVKLRLKNVKDETLKALDSSLKTDILSFYATSVLMSKTPAPIHANAAFHDFIEAVVTQDDLTSSVLPTMEKALLRSPEISLFVVTQFFDAYRYPVEGDIFRKVLTSALNSAKSANPLVRKNASLLFRAMISKTSSSDDLTFSVSETLSLPKSGKTTGPDHRMALYSMLGFVRPASSASTAIMQTSLPLLAKETHDGAVSVLTSALVPHLVFCLRENVVLPGDAVSVITKELTGAKPVIRRAFCSLVGDAFWQLEVLHTEVALSLAKAVLPALEINLKTVAAAPLTSAAGPLEGYTAVAVLLGPCSRSGKFDDVIAHNATVQSLMTAGSKPSFLLWDKVYQKLNGEDDEKWLLRAAQASLAFFQRELLRNEPACAMIGMVFLHLVINSPLPQTRRETLKTLEESVAQLPEVASVAIVSALSAYVSKEKASSAKVQNGSSEENEPKVNREGRLSAFLLAAQAFSEECDSATRKTALVRCVVLAHHPALGVGSRQIWIEACQKGRVDPLNLVVERADELFKEIQGALDFRSKVATIS